MRKQTLLGFLLWIVTALSASAQDRLVDTKVSDTAGKLTAEQHLALTKKLTDFEALTAVDMRIAIRSDVSPEDRSAYAGRLANRSGIGRTYDNGIMILWSPNTRVYHITSAEKWWRDISSEDLSEIATTKLVPAFRGERFYEGLDQTIDAIIAQIGTEPWEQRMARWEIQRSQNHKRLFKVVCIAIVVITILIVLAIGWSRRDTRNLMSRILNNIEAQLKEANTNLPTLAPALSELRSEMPEQNISKLESDLASHENSLASANRQFATYNPLLLNHKEIDDVRDLSEVAYRVSQFATKLFRNIERIRNAKEKSQNLMAQLSDKSFDGDDLEIKEGRGEKTSALLAAAKANYGKAQSLFQLTGDSMMDWVLFLELIVLAQHGVAQAHAYAAGESLSTGFSSDGQSYDSITVSGMPGIGSVTTFGSGPSAGGTY